MVMIFRFRQLVIRSIKGRRFRQVFLVKLFVFLVTIQIIWFMLFLMLYLLLVLKCVIIKSQNEKRILSQNQLRQVLDSFRYLMKEDKGRRRRMKRRRRRIMKTMKTTMKTTIKMTKEIEEEEKQQLQYLWQQW